MQKNLEALSDENFEIYKIAQLSTELKNVSTKLEGKIQIVEKNHKMKEYNKGNNQYKDTLLKTISIGSLMDIFGIFGRNYFVRKENYYNSIKETFE